MRSSTSPQPPNSRRTAGCRRAGLPPAANAARKKHRIFTSGGNKKPATRTALPRSGHFRLAQSPHHHKGQHHNRRAAPEDNAQTPPAGGLDAHTKSSAKTGACKAFAPSYGSATRFAGRYHTSRCPPCFASTNRGPQALSTTCLAMLRVARRAHIPTIASHGRTLDWAAATPIWARSKSSLVLGALFRRPKTSHETSSARHRASRPGHPCTRRRRASTGIQATGMPCESQIDRGRDDPC